MKLLKTALVAALFAAGLIPAHAQTQTSIYNLAPAAAPPASTDWMVGGQAGAAVRFLVKDVAGFANAGTTAPTNPSLYELWANTGVSPIALERWDGGQWVTLGTINTSTHVFTPANSLQPGNNLSDVASAATARHNIGADNASNLVNGNLPSAAMPAPTASSLGGVQSYTAPGGQFLTGLSTSGVFTSGAPLSAAPYPGGRLTLTPNTPVMTADVTGATVIYYDTYVFGLVPANGTALAITSNQLSMGLATANVLSGSLYDVFAVNNSGALAICAGPAWTNSTTRSAGVGLANGLWTNSSSLTHCYGGAAGTTDYGPISANQATYLGSFYATANGQTAMQFNPAAAAGGPNAMRAIWNAYNRVRAPTFAEDSTSSWTYNGTTWRGADNSNSNRITFIDGLAQSPFDARYDDYVDNGSADGFIGVGINSTSSQSGVKGVSNNVSHTQTTIPAEASSGPLLGLNYVQAIENTNGGTPTFGGSSEMGLRFDGDY